MSQGHPPAQPKIISHSVLNGKVTTSGWPCGSGPPSYSSPASSRQESAVKGPSGQGSLLTITFASKVPAKSHPQPPSRAPANAWRRPTGRFKGYRNAEDLLLLAETAVAVGACTVKRGEKHVVFEKLGQVMHAKGVEGSDAVFSKRLNELLAWYESSGESPDNIRETIDLGGASLRDKITAALRILSEQKRKEQPLQPNVSNPIKVEPDDGEPSLFPVAASSAKTPAQPLPRPMVTPMSLPPISFLSSGISDSSSVSTSPTKPCEVATAVAAVEPNPFLTSPISCNSINPQLLYKISPEFTRLPPHPYNRPADPSTALRSFSINDISDLLNAEPVKPQAQSAEQFLESALNSPLFSNESVSASPASAPGIAWVPLPNNSLSGNDQDAGGVSSESSRSTEIRGTKRTRDDDDSEEGGWRIREFLEADQRERRGREELFLKEIREISRRQLEDIENARAFREDAMKVLRRIKMTFT
ncbi:hypothetical protein Moror_9692 [Moniliophthora roreri MCA 2997]|uniref:Uncharacterized protein n=2 Tax=Moniliophthora roreri TaxID=221103 RepID=V2X1M4_MONRO|nr:hypothetical protein Moror_9692 [Moniliophthora roreri MCA 2997]